MLTRPLFRFVAGVAALIALVVPSVRVLLPGILEQDPPTPEAVIRLLIHTPDQARDLSVNVRQSIRKDGSLSFGVDLTSEVAPFVGHDVTVAIFPLEGEYLPDIECDGEYDPNPTVKVVRNVTAPYNVKAPSVAVITQHLFGMDEPGSPPRQLHEVSTRLTAGIPNDPASLRSVWARSASYLSCRVESGASVTTTGTYFPRGNSAADAPRKMLNFARIMWLRHSFLEASEAKQPTYGDPLPTDGTIWAGWAYERDDRYQMVDASAEFEYLRENWAYEETPMRMGSTNPACTREVCWGRDQWVYLQRTNYDRVKSTKSFLLGITVSLITTIVGFSARAAILHFKGRRRQVSAPPSPAPPTLTPPPTLSPMESGNEAGQ